MSIKTGEIISNSNPELKAKTFTMTMEGGYEATVMTYGAVITELIVPDKDGKPTDIMLGCKGLDEYMGNGANHGAVIGRSANRIKDASFVINGVKYQIPKNEGENNLHSGNPGFQNVFWDGKIITEEEADSMILDSKIAGIPGCVGDAVLFSYESPDGATGFPGNLYTKVLYCWLDALGWATYNGDHMSMYGVNAGIPKTLIQFLVRYVAESGVDKESRLTLLDIVDTPISPELTPADEQGNIKQKTEDLVGPYELHDFFLYYFLRFGFRPRKIYLLARQAFSGSYDDETIKRWLTTFFRRFFSQQFKRSCLPDGPKVGSVSLSPRGDWRMPSDASSALWLKDCESL